MAYWCQSGASSLVNNVSLLVVIRGKLNDVSQLASNSIRAIIHVQPGVGENDLVSNAKVLTLIVLQNVC
jgi:hypothetical protein